MSRKDTIRIIEEFANAHINPPNEGKAKVFYHYTEWSGWRFYLKAIRNKDWKSLKNHIKSHISYETN